MFFPPYQARGSFGGIHAASQCGFMAGGGEVPADALPPQGGDGERRGSAWGTTGLSICARVPDRELSALGADAVVKSFIAGDDDVRGEALDGRGSRGITQ